MADPGLRVEGVQLYGKLLVKKVDNVLFRRSVADDVLFIDTSNVLKCQSDVEWELLHIRLSLNLGVMIHIHDNYTPYEQPQEWLLGRYAPGAVNEQYAVETLLSGCSCIEVCLPLHLRGREYFGMADRPVGACEIADKVSGSAKISGPAP